MAKGLSKKQENTESDINPRQRKFIEAYLGSAHFNATKAAELAGYKGSKNVLGVTAYDLLRNPKIKEEIDLVLSVMSMPGNVVITRLTQITEGKVSDFYNETGNFDLDLAKKKGIDHLIKKLKVKRIVKQKKAEAPDSMREFLELDELEEIESSTEILHEEVEFELYSAHEALRDLGKHHKLFTDRTELSGAIQNVGMTIDEFKKEAAESLKQANETMAKFDE